MEPFPSKPSPITTRERCSPLPSLHLGSIAKRRWGSSPHTRTNEKAWGYQGFAALISRRNTSQYCSPACASKQRNLDGFCGKKEVSAAYKRIVANLTAKDKKQKELRRQYCLDGGAVVKPREVLRQFYEENYAHQEQFRSAWEALNKAEKKSWADRKAYEQAKTEYLSWLDSWLSFAKRIHIDNDSFQEEP